MGSVGSCGQGVGSRSDDRAQGVGGQRVAEVKVGGREGVRRAGRGRASGPSRLPPSLADPLLSGGLSAGSWGSAILPMTQEMLLCPTAYPQSCLLCLALYLPRGLGVPALATKYFSSRTYFLYTKPFPFSPTLSLASQSPNFYVIHFLSFFAGFAPTIESITDPCALFCP